MNTDPSNNLLRRRQNEYNDRFNLNQFYNAVEDEQQYMNEYASLVHRYNDFITNGNAMFSRMEQTIRENLTRTIVRQSFYYNSRQVPYAAAAAAEFAPAPAPVPAPGPAPAPAPPVQQPSSSAFIDAALQQLQGTQLLSRYLNNEHSRGARQTTRQSDNTNIFSMLYTVPIGVRRNVNEGGGGGAPTNEQIHQATMNTVFGNILSPVNATCPISRDEFNDDSEITMIRSCNHIFNRSSLREWFVNHSTCPMCRGDIRDYTPSPARGPANLTIDRIDNDHLTFSYDLPMNYNNDQIYQDIINTVNNITNNRGDRGDDGEDMD